MNAKRLLLHTLLAGIALASSAAQAADKSKYHLFNPTPVDQMREMSTDRPDKTESPYTVDAGRFQIEMDLATYSYDKHNTARDGTIVRTWNVAPANFKVGLLNNVDAQFIVQPHTYVHTSDPAAGVSRQRGFNDFLTRVKFNLWGNDEGQTAFALMPYAKFPTSQDRLGNRSVEGGLIAPFAMELPAGWSMGLMPQIDIVRNTARSGHHAEFVHTITFGHDIVGKLAGYMEFFSSVSTERGAPWVGTVDFGFTYGLSENVQLDGGLNIGVTRSAEDWNPFVGITWRF